MLEFLVAARDDDYDRPVLNSYCVEIIQCTTIWSWFLSIFVHTLPCLIPYPVIILGQIKLLSIYFCPYKFNYCTVLGIISFCNDLFCYDLFYHTLLNWIPIKFSALGYLLSSVMWWIQATIWKIVMKKVRFLLQDLKILI